MGLRIFCINHRNLGINSVKISIKRVKISLRIGKQVLFYCYEWKFFYEACVIQRKLTKEGKYDERGKWINYSK